MILSKEQIKKAKSICKENGISPSLVTKDGYIGDGFWLDYCSNSFDGYLAYLTGNNKPNGVAIFTSIMQSKVNCTDGNYGLTSITK